MVTDCFRHMLRTEHSGFSPARINARLDGSTEQTWNCLGGKELDCGFEDPTGASPPELSDWPKQGQAFSKSHRGLVNTLGVWSRLHCQENG